MEEIQEFENKLIMGMLFSLDLTHVLVKKNYHSHLDGMLVQNDESESPQVILSKIINEELSLNLDPVTWKPLTTLQHMGKMWRIDVYTTTYDIENTHLDDNIQIISVNDLPDNIHPNLRWIIPISLDLTVHGSMFNQILMK